MDRIGACSTSYSCHESSHASRFGRRPTVQRLSRRERLVLQPVVTHTARLQPGQFLCTALGHETASAAPTPVAGSNKVVRLEVGDAEVVLEVAPLAAPVLPPPRYKIERAVRKAETLQDLHQILSNREKPPDHFTTSAAVYRLAKLSNVLRRSLPGPAYQAALQDYVNPCLAVLRPYVLKYAPQMDSWGAAMSLWAYGALGHMDLPVFNALCKSLISMGGSLKTVDCANAMYCFGHLGQLHKELAKVVVQSLLNHLDECKPHELSTTLWAFAKLRCSPDPNFMEAVVDFVQYNAAKFGTQELSNVLYALGLLGYRPQVRFLQQMEHLTMVRLQHLGTQDMSNSLWAFAKLQYKAVLLLDAAPEYLVPRVSQFKQQELSMLLYAYAAPRHYHRTCTDAIIDTMLPQLSAMDQQDLCTVVWVLGNFRHRPSNPAVMPALTAEVHARMRQFKPVGLALVAKSFARLGWRSETMLKELTRVAENKLQDFRLMEVAHLLYGLAQLRYAELPIYYAAVRRAIMILEEEDTNPEGMSGRRLSQLVPSLNSISSSCQDMGYVPYTLIDYAESKGLRIKQPMTGRSSIDEADDALPTELQGRSGGGRAAMQHYASSRAAGRRSSYGAPGGLRGAYPPPQNGEPGVEDSWGEDYWEGDNDSDYAYDDDSLPDPNGTFSRGVSGASALSYSAAEQRQHANGIGMHTHEESRTSGHQRRDAVATSSSSGAPGTDGGGAL